MAAGFLFVKQDHNKGLSAILALGVRKEEEVEVIRCLKLCSMLKLHSRPLSWIGVCGWGTADVAFSIEAQLQLNIP